MQTWQLQSAHKFAVPLDGRSGRILKSNRSTVVFSFQINFMVYWSQLWRRAGGVRGGPAPVAMELCQGEEKPHSKGSHTCKWTWCHTEAHLALGEGEKLKSLCWELSNWHLLLLCPSSPSNNLFIAIPLLQISLHSHKARFFKKYMHSYSCQVWIPTFFIFHKEKGWFLWYPRIFPHCWSESRLPVRRRAVSLPYLDGDVILPLIQNLAGS